MKAAIQLLVTDYVGKRETLYIKNKGEIIIALVLRSKSVVCKEMFFSEEQFKELKFYEI